MMTNRRKAVRTVSFLTALVVVLAIWGTVNTVRYKNVQRQMAISRERALTELGTYMDTISLNLDKSIYASTAPMMETISTTVWRASTAAKSNLAEITDGEAQVSPIYKFLSQVGEYTMTLNEKLNSGEKLTEEESETLYRLKDYAGKLSSEINYLIDEQESGGLDFESVKSTLSNDGASSRLILGTELNDTAETMKDYPTLIYDGPFSDHINTGKSEITENLKEITEEEAKTKAAEFIDADESKIYFLSECESNLGCYTFYNADCTVSVTKKGGLVSYMLYSRYAGESKIKASDAVEKATKYLESKGYKNIKESYYAASDGICTVNFAYYKDSVIFYPDLIKVSVALDTGEITAFDSTGYLMNHRERNVDVKTKYTEKECRDVLNDNLTVKSVRKAVIPTDFETESYTYEYHCVAEDKTEVLVYIDPDTREEKNILILLYSDNGILTK